MAVLVWGCCKRLVKKHHNHNHKQGVKTRTIELRLAPSSLHDDALHFHIPGEEDSQEDFERSHQALGRIQLKLFEYLGQREARGLRRGEREEVEMSLQERENDIPSI